MFPYHALHAMGKKKYNAILPHPFGLPRADELVDDTLSCIVEVTKLSFPNHQSIGTGHSKAQLKSCIDRNGKLFLGGRRLSGRDRFKNQQFT